MTRSELLRALERLTHAGRMRRMVEIGRLATSDPIVTETLERLERGDFYERYRATGITISGGFGLGLPAAWVVDRLRREAEKRLHELEAST